MVVEFIKLQFKQTVRSTALARNIVGGIVIGFIVFIFLINLLIFAFGLPVFLRETMGVTDVIGFLNNHLLFFFLTELLYRFFFQKLPVLELQHFLHLPIRRTAIIHYLLIKSFLSPLSIVSLICFVPLSITSVPSGQSLSWLINLVILSWALHWFMLLYKQKYGENLAGIIGLFIFTFIGFGANYYGYVNFGEYAAPFFEWSMQSFVPAIFAFAFLVFNYLLAFTYYLNNTYLEELGGNKNRISVSGPFSILSKFGLAGEFADLELKLILRHKKSRNYLIFSGLFLLYGLFFYTDIEPGENGFSYLYIFVGIFLTGSFLIQYGQLFLSWNSKTFDFYLSRENGIEALIRGKYLLFIVISTLCFLLTIPYVYFGWEIILVHLATFLFNMGISIHIIVHMSLWQPKPMDLTQGNLFSYEGMGAAQFLMIFPLMILPYLVFLPIAYLSGDFFGLAALGAAGILGIIFSDHISGYFIRKLERSKYKISATFRQEL